MNIKRGLKRIWIVGSVLWMVMIIGGTIYTFPEQPKQYDKDVEEFFSIDKTEEEIRIEKRFELEIYEKKKKKSLLVVLYNLCGLVLMWGLLYTGFWISSGFSSDKKKDETNE